MVNWILSLFSVVFWATLFVVISWLLCYFLLEIFNWEFVSEHEDLFFGIGVISIPFLVFTYLLKIIKPKEHWYFIAGKILLGSFYSILVIFIIAIASFQNMCNWTTEKVLFINKENPGLQIAERHYGCGAWDSSPAIKKHFKIKSISSILIKITPIELTDLDKKEWQAIDPN